MVCANYKQLVYFQSSLSYIHVCARILLDTENNSVWLQFGFRGEVDLQRTVVSTA